MAGHGVRHLAAGVLLTLGPVIAVRGLAGESAWVVIAHIPLGDTAVQRPHTRQSCRLPRTATLGSPYGISKRWVMERMRCGDAAVISKS
ncbi:hypothetical protein ABH927_001539 [Planotetraspora sp. GP83]